jgi:hypothetical protein
LSAAPAENLGTRPPAIVIRSPVRGFTPWRGPRSATLNLPKPVKLTLSPRASAEEIVSMTVLMFSLAAFLLPIRPSAREQVDELSLGQGSSSRGPGATAI